MLRTFKIKISGQVQGVGFRPFIFNLAQEFNLNGTVYNDENGVEILINAQEKIAHTFLQTLLNRSPRVSKIQGYNLNSVPLQQFKGFSIQKSKESEKLNIPLTPDFAICDSCIQDIRDTTNRRFGYPFTTCTSCGPRYSITEKFPFDRLNISVSRFEMCRECNGEYNSFEDRRFHSQTNSCSACGIELEFEDANGKELAINQKNLLGQVAKYLCEGHILAIKNTNGYLLCCDANNAQAIQNLRKKKQRPSKPFAVLYPSLEMIKSDFQVNPYEEEMLTSQIGPIVILMPKKSIDRIKNDIIAPRLDHLGIMLPTTALLRLLMDHIKTPIIATSGNIHGAPIVSNKEEAREKLSTVADYFLHHNLSINFAQDDSVIRFIDSHPIILRRSRGMAPNYLEKFPKSPNGVLAMGANLKSTFTFAPNSQVYISQYFGNLDNYDVLQRYQDYILKFTALFNATPEVILIDDHRQYQSTVLGNELAKEFNAQIKSIQHHKAHFASVLGENGLFDSNEKILGVVWDGTGLGPDGNIWGGEFFNYENYEIGRLLHFEYVNWIAGDKMAKEPRLSLLSIMDNCQNECFKSKFRPSELKNYEILLKKNQLKTSSVGRLFDAVASLLEIKDICSYEGEAAMLLENIADRYNGNKFIDFLEGHTFENIPTTILLMEILQAKKNGEPIELISYSFIYTLALLILKISAKFGYKTIACSGGVFQNQLLVKKLLELSHKSGIKLIFNRILSSNDENISFGQLCYYHHVKN